MRLPKNIKKKWVKSLRSGEYTQGKFRLYNANAIVQSFCCLGVLEHICMDGEVEYDYKRDGYLDIPSPQFFDYAGIEVTKNTEGQVVDKDLNKLIKMNDSSINRYSFNDIADYIEKEIKTI